MYNKIQNILQKIYIHNLGYVEVLQNVTGLLTCQNSWQQSTNHAEHPLELSFTDRQSTFFTSITTLRISEVYSIHSYRIDRKERNRENELLKIINVMKRISSALEVTNTTTGPNM